MRSKEILVLLDMNYNIVKLGEYLYIKGRIGWKGLKKDEYLAFSPYRIINGEALSDNGIAWDKAGYISQSRYEESPEIMLCPNDILISKDGTIGKIGFVNVLDMPTTVSSGIFVVRNLKPDVINTRFIYHFLKSPFFKDFIKMRTEGSVIPHLYQKDFVDLDFPLPDLSIQNKLVGLLDSLEKKIEVNWKINKNLLQQANTILTSYFIDFTRFNGKIPDNWEQGTLQDIADFSNGYAFKSKELLNAPESNCYKVFKQGHIKRGGGFNSSGTKSWYPINKCSALTKYILRRGDVLMAMTDMKDNVAILGNTALMTVDDQYIVNQRVGLIRSNGYKKTSYAYIYLLTNSFDFLKDLRSRANSGVQVNLSSSEIKNSLVWIASENVNEEFNRLTEPLLTMIMNIDNENQRLADLRDTLLPKLMSGDIDVSDLQL